MKRQLPALLLLITLIFSLAAGTISYADPGPGIDIRLTTAHFGATILFTGAPQRPELTVELDGVFLTEGQDYELSFTDNLGNPLPSAPSVIGNYHFIIHGIGAYTDTVTYWFEIIDAGDLIRADISLNQYLYSYTGSAIKPDLSIWLGTRLLIENRD